MELQQNGVDCLRWVGEQMFTMKSEMVSQPSVVSDVLVQSVDQKYCQR
jgi:hypothetical protein